MEGFTCPSCGEGKIIDEARPGRTMRYRQISALELPDDLKIPTCSHCGEEWLDAETTTHIQAALEEAYRKELIDRSNRAIQKLRKAIPQRDLESLIGVSGGLLSKIRSGKDTSPLLTSLLMLLAEQLPLVDSLKRLWASSATSDGSEIRQNAALDPAPAAHRSLYLVPNAVSDQPSQAAVLKQLDWAELAA